MAKSSSSRGKSGGKSGGGSNKNTFDKIAKAAMSREMLAAVKDAGLEAADSASAAATQMMTNASKLGSLIAEAVADAAQRVLSGKWADEGGGTAVTATPKPVAKRAAPRKTGATRKAPAAKKTASKPKAARPAAKAGASAKRRSSAGARKRAAAKPKAPPAG